jgi:hypothetical protein
MERQMIERLAMDAALGELNEDAEALLNAYLAEHAEARTWAQSMTAVCAQTRNAIDTRTTRNDTLTVPALLRTSIHWARAARWAAVVMVSLLIGVGIGRRPEPLATAPPVNVVLDTTRRATVRSWQEIVRAPGNGFWESKAAAVWQSKPYRTSVSQPNLWEAFKQLQKGHDYEQSRQ